MDTSLVALLVRVVVSLGVVLLVMWGAATVLRRSGVTGTAAASGARRGLRRRPAAVEIVSRHGLTRGASITVVRMGTRGLVLGVTEHQVSLLTEIDPEELEAPPEEATVAGPAGPGIGSGSLPWKVALEQLRERTVRRS
ncbi:MAG TPA: flagellar biosynthetic protein FliO [Acidimicrobiia bacterium]|nr:flagellar biosynthetic protein FliO [Acidimicrobiia bacterium]